MDPTGDHRPKELLHQRYVTAGAAVFAFWQDIPEGKVSRRVYGSCEHRNLSCSNGAAAVICGNIHRDSSMIWR